MKKTTEKKKINKPNTQKKVIKSNKKVTKKVSKKNKEKLLLRVKDNKRNMLLTLFVIFILAILLIVSSYAWFSTALNVKIHTFNMLVTRNDGLSISHDAVTYNSFIDISKELLYDDLGRTYPGYITTWPSNGLIPVSTNGNNNKNSYFFDVFTTNGVFYPNILDKTKAYVTTKKYYEDKPKKYAYFLAFDVFFKNDSGSPVADNLYFDAGTAVVKAEEISEQMDGLINSIRIGIVKVGSLPMTATPKEVQNIQCNNDCEAIIYEPYKNSHTKMSITNAQKYNLDLRDGEPYPTYANVNEVTDKLLYETISGSQSLDTNNFKLQETVSENEFRVPLFKVPDGYTKARIYVWIEGQDIDSLETHSVGTDVDIIINFAKDTLGYNQFDEE